MSTLATRFGEQGRGWQAAQLAVLAATLGFIADVAIAPTPSITLFWNAIVPLLPLSFLVSPILWRSVCPLATLNVLASRPAATPRAHGEGRGASGGTTWIAIALLLLIVPARHIGLNTNGVALAVFITVTAIVALVAGSREPSRAGFCNLLCPVVPVERLYGQQPLLAMKSPRCATCVACTPRGCLDVAREKTVPQLLGRARRGDAWLTTSFGAFASAFPGFIIGYFQAPDVAPVEALRVYGPVAAWALASVLLVNAIVRLGRVDSKVAMPLLAGAAIGAYYFCAAPGIMRALEGPAWGGLAMRVVTIAFVGAWTVRAVARTVSAREVHEEAMPRALPVLVD